MTFDFDKTILEIVTSLEKIEIENLDSEYLQLYKDLEQISEVIFYKISSETSNRITFYLKPKTLLNSRDTVQIHKLTDKNLSEFIEKYFVSDDYVLVFDELCIVIKGCSKESFLKILELLSQHPLVVKKLSLVSAMQSNFRMDFWIANDESSFSTVDIFHFKTQTNQSIKLPESERSGDRPLLEFSDIGGDTLVNLLKFRNRYWEGTRILQNQYNNIVEWTNKKIADNNYESKIINAWDGLLDEDMQAEIGRIMPEDEYIVLFFEYAMYLANNELLQLFLQHIESAIDEGSYLESDGLIALNTQSFMYRDVGSENWDIWWNNG
ncbi:hypothetical protein NIES267_73780 (plasmid) [Calothrix parasitica NIES-267]|uniref:Uncharacterized protein n=1 Tax=Calothrix parasitica NIES-267 TaxID=1973488 RepID=A0A1Z4M2Y0_9CYAN|nr:hypothetical protein NIES267_73780 [Calothrix parasitica NIES-267]